MQSGGRLRQCLWPPAEWLTGEEVLLGIDEVVGGFVHFNLTLPWLRHVPHSGVAGYYVKLQQKEREKKIHRLDRVTSHFSDQSACDWYFQTSAPRQKWMWERKQGAKWSRIVQAICLIRMRHSADRDCLGCPFMPILNAVKSEMISCFFRGSCWFPCYFCIIKTNVFGLNLQRIYQTDKTVNRLINSLFLSVVPANSQPLRFQPYMIFKVSELNTFHWWLDLYPSYIKKPEALRLTANISASRRVLYCMLLVVSTWSSWPLMVGE